MFNFSRHLPALIWGSTLKKGVRSLWKRSKLIAKAISLHYIGQQNQAEVIWSVKSVELKYRKQQLYEYLESQDIVSLNLLQ